MVAPFLIDQMPEETGSHRRQSNLGTQFLHRGCSGRRFNSRVWLPTSTRPAVTVPTFPLHQPGENGRASHGASDADDADDQIGRTVLVVDHEPTILHILPSGLVFFGFNVFAVSSGEEAVALLRRAPR